MTPRRAATLEQDRTAARDTGAHDLSYLEQHGALPVVVVAGRPNVGKSTLVNRIIGRRVAIVEEHPGVTRDRLELVAEWRGREFVLVDTGGVLERGASLDQKVTEQALRAVRAADVVLFLLDASTGVTADDEAVARLLRKAGRDVLLVANKVDSENREDALYELARLGFGDAFGISAMHGRSVGDLLDAVVDRFATGREQESKERASEPERPDAVSAIGAELAAVAIVGRPNVGKSTLFNRLVGDERSVVHDVPGTTRDAIDTVVETNEGLIRLIDTAGLRRKSRIEEGTEYYSLVRSLSAIDRADVALLLMDASAGVTHQEQRLAERVDVAGSPIVLVFNKWDLCGTEQRLRVARELEDRLGFLAYAPVIRISAQSGAGVHRLLPAIRAALVAYRERIPTSRLNDALHLLQSAHPAPGARILFGVQGAASPPTFTLFATKRLPASYLRYVERSLRERFELGPTAMKLRVRLRGS